MLANRPDLVREAYMNELCVLQDDVPPFPDNQVRLLGGAARCWARVLGVWEGRDDDFAWRHVPFPMQSTSRRQ